VNPPRLSLVVPVYNVADYLPRCLESLALLDPPADEIIAVDDGSTDNCPRILKEWTGHIPQLLVVRQENGGLSAARNTGLMLATGTYLAFVDSDDTLVPEAYRRALELAEAEQLDLVMFNGWFHHEGRSRDRIIYPKLASSGVLSGVDWLVRSRLGSEFLHYAPLNLYRRSFIEAHNLRFIPRRLHEDVVWTTEVLLNAQRVMFDATPYYLYRQLIRRFDQTTMQGRLDRIVISSEANARDLDRIIYSYRIEGPARNMLSYQLTDGALSIFHKLSKMPDRHAASTWLRCFRRDGLLALLWHHAQSTAQRRRIARHWLRSWFWIGTQ
jgi:heptose III glucuronosyltransferase